MLVLAQLPVFGDTPFPVVAIICVLAIAILLQLRSLARPSGGGKRTFKLTANQQAQLQDIQERFARGEMTYDQQQQAIGRLYGEQGKASTPPVTGAQRMQMDAVDDPGTPHG